MYKELISTDRVGLVIDTNEWLLGIDLIFDKDDTGYLLQFGFLCLHLFIAIN